MRAINVCNILTFNGYYTLTMFNHSLIEMLSMMDYELCFDCVEIKLKVAETISNLRLLNDVA